ncbi:MAG: FAD-dependent oxidoreductase [Cyclobacteriaceae bacterium]
MQKKRRDFMKTLGAGSGAFFVNPTTIFGQRPVKEMGKIDTEAYQKRSYDTDVLIAGGGMTGVCAAIAAARNGAKVILIQDRSRLGGNASSEIRMHISGSSQLKQVWRETGILEELVLTEAAENQQKSYEMWDFILYDKVVSEENITLLLDTALFDVEAGNGKIQKVKALCSQTEELYEISARYFADCTGDGTLAAKAGAEFMQGREAQSQWGESLATAEPDLKTMGNSILFMASPHDQEMPYTPPTWARKYGFKDFVHRKISSFEYGYWWIELGGMVDAVKDGQAIRHELLSVVYGIWDYIKNSGNHPDAKNWALSWVGMLPGKRESRRIVGDYIMKQDDVQSPKLFDDRVAYGGWPLDDHPPEGMDSTGIEPYRSIPLRGPYSIPFRSLYSKDFNNLLMAGRNISVSHVALSSTRVMATCATMGQAVGTAMAYCYKHSISPATLVQDHIKQLQQTLLRQDQALLGVKNEDEQDLARQATVKASSETTDGAAINVIDGVNRDIADGSTHQWRAEMNAATPWVELRWEKPVTINLIQITFDTGLQRFLRISGQAWVLAEQERCPQHETIANYTIEGIINDKKQVLHQAEGNYLRRVEHHFEAVEVDAIRINVEKTHGDLLAKIFEVRCYQEA